MRRGIDEAELLGILQGFNPWWSGKQVQAPAFRRLAFQVALQNLENPAIKRAILLTGPRRVGKTTILLQIAQKLATSPRRHPQSVLYLSLDHPLLKLWPLHETLRLYHETFWPEGQEAVLLLDEIQYAEDWDRHLKILVDHKPFYKIVATGSVSPLLRRGEIESGVGRWTRVPTPPLSFFEFLRIRGEAAPLVPEDLRPFDLFGRSAGELAQIATQFKPLAPSFQRYLLVGGFPETAMMPDIATGQRLLREDVVERVLKRDLTALFGIRNVADLERLFIYLCLHSGSILSVQACASALEVSHVTVANHLEALEASNLIYRLPQMAAGGKAALKVRHKIYLKDAALRNAVLLKGEEVLANPTEMGLIVETAILRHLSAYYYRDTPEILYWREPKTGVEVDIVVRSPKYVIPVEVKYRGDATLGPKEGLVAFCGKEEASRAFWVTRDDRAFDTGIVPGSDCPVLRVPAHILAYLLGQAERSLWGLGAGS